MNSPTMTSTQSKAARAALGISQSKVAHATGINRTQLALFEVKKYVLDEAKLSALREYFETQGYAFDSTATVRQFTREAQAPVARLAEPAPQAALQSDTKVIDRFVVPAGVEDEILEALLDELDANDRRIDELALQAPQFDWLGEPKPGAQAEILRLMARNYLRVRQLQFGMLGSATEADTAEQDAPATVGDLVSRAIGLPLATLAAD
ncbi:MAG: helix-turn-helix domain-containing protein [Burkholderiales bacterium]